MISLLPRFTEVRAGLPAPGKRKVVVFVHGIFSSAATFDALLASVRNDRRFDSYDLATYEYDWGEPILTSAARMRHILNVRLPEALADVTLVGHSMGGLVSRFALIGGDLPCVRRIFMLGTPNFGAITAAQVSLLWQVAIAAAGRVTPVFPRKRGLRDLTRVQGAYRSVAASIPQAASRARSVEYITLPGLYYHDERRDTDPGDDGAALPFTIGTLVLRALALWSWAEIKIERPHDGVVEEASVSLIPRKAGRFSEKSVSIQQSPKHGRTYCHATAISALDSMHMAIQSDASVAEVIKGILLAGSIVAWDDALPLAARDGFINVEIP
ncbi:MAG: alpha/beta fold hydrolase [Gemmatimonadaceae bacterium]